MIQTLQRLARVPLKRTLAFLLFLGCMLSLTALGYLRADSRKQWTTATFLDLIDGTATDGGVNTYVTAAGDVRLINVLDLNNDGNSDIVLPGSQNYDESVDLFVYWADAQGFSPVRRAALPSDGGVGCEIADLNRDGYADIVVANRFNGETTSMPSYVYWGGKAGFDADRRAELPTKAASGVRAADLNGDGWPDIVFANQGVDYHMTVDRFKRSYIYWGSPAGYSASNRLELPTCNAMAVEISDVNEDSYPDVVFVNEGNGEEESGAILYWGSKGGAYSADRCLRLPGLYSSAASIADLNSDGYPEIVLANRYRLGPKPLPPTWDRVLTSAVNSYVYWGSATGYNKQNRTELPTVGAAAVAVGDLNQDKRPDLIFANSVAADAFIYWGTKDGYRPNKRTALPAPNATDVALDDLNSDGFPDLVFAVFSVEGSRETDSWVYWGDARGFRPERRAALPTKGAMAVGVADLNGDGKKDLVFINKIDGTIESTPGRTPRTHIYWGDDRGEFSRDRQQSLPSASDMYSVADLNQDGWLDLLLSLRPQGLQIYWGGNRGLSEERRTLLPFSADYMRVADLNRDGYLDLAMTVGTHGDASLRLLFGGPSGFSVEHGGVLPISGYSSVSVADINRDGWPDLILPTRAETGELRIYFNSQNGFFPQNTLTLTLPSYACVVAEVADLNADGFLDLVIVNQTKAELTEVPQEKRVYDANAWTDSFVYWGGREGYSPARRSELPTVGAIDALVRDLNNDGFLDLVFASYHAGAHRSYPSYIYWGGPQGFDKARRTSIPTHSGSGILAADFNRDGWQDLLFSCHVYDGNHRTDSFLYWGSPSGFSTERRTLLPSIGTHFLSLADVGNIHDRTDRYDYISPPFDAGKEAVFERISWEGKTPFRTGLEFQVRVAPTREELSSAKWQGPQGGDSHYRTPGSSLAGFPTSGRWVQYKASLLSPEGTNTPVLKSVTIEYREK